jgi:hypothetical protein
MSLTVSGRLISPSVSSYVPPHSSASCRSTYTMAMRPLSSSSMRLSTAPKSFSRPRLLLSKMLRATAGGLTPASTHWRQISNVRGVMFE